MMMGTSELEATAFHEAGHTAAALWFGIGFERVSVIPDESDNSLGHVLMNKFGKNFRPDLIPNGRESWYDNRMRKLVLISLAGPGAEREHVGQWNHHGAGKDYSDCVTWLMYLYPPFANLTPVLRNARAAARKMVKDYLWSTVEPLAAELIEKKVMPRGVAIKIFQAHSSTRGSIISGTFNATSLLLPTSAVI